MPGKTCNKAKATATMAQANTISLIFFSSASKSRKTANKEINAVRLCTGSVMSSIRKKTILGKEKNFFLKSDKTKTNIAKSMI